MPKGVEHIERDMEMKCASFRVESLMPKGVEHIAAKPAKLAPSKMSNL